MNNTQDETAGWSASKLYSEAKDAQADGTYDKAAKYLEKLESAFRMAAMRNRHSSNWVMFIGKVANRALHWLPVIVSLNCTRITRRWITLITSRA